MLISMPSLCVGFNHLQWRTHIQDIPCMPCPFGSSSPAPSVTGAPLSSVGAPPVDSGALLVDGEAPLSSIGAPLVIVAPS